MPQQEAADIPNASTIKPMQDPIQQLPKDSYNEIQFVASGKDLTGQNCPPAGFSIVTGNSGISVAVCPVKTDGTLAEPVAEVVVDYYNNKLQVVTWDYEQMGGDGLQTVLTENFRSYNRTASEHLHKE